MEIFNRAVFQNKMIHIKILGDSALNLQGNDDSIIGRYAKGYCF